MIWQNIKTKKKQSSDENQVIIYLQFFRNGKMGIGSI